MYSMTPLNSFVIMSGDFYKLYSYQLLLNIVPITKVWKFLIGKLMFNGITRLLAGLWVEAI